MQPLSVSQLARAAGVGIETVRHYETLGLLPTPARDANGYRRFAPDSLRRMDFIRRAKALGFSLPEVQELLALSDGRHGDMECLHLRASDKLAAVEQRIAELQRIRDGLAHLIAACPGHGPMQECPILSALTGPAPKGH